MSFYDAFKEVLNIAQKADNLDLYRQLLDLSRQALDMQEEINRLRTENSTLRQKKNLSESIERHFDPVVTVRGENPSIHYCAQCWDTEGKLVQLTIDNDGGYHCQHCQAHGFLRNIPIQYS